MTAQENMPLKAALQQMSAKKALGPGEPPAPIEELPLLIFSLGTSELFAMPLAGVEEIIRPTQLYFMPGVPGYITGVLIRRLEIIAVLDLAGLLQPLAPDSLQGTSRTIIQRWEDIVVGFEVSQVIDMVSVASDSIHKIPDEVEIGPHGELCQGYIEIDGRPVALIDIEKLINNAMEDI